MYKAPPPEMTTEQFYETDPGRDFARGFSIQTVSPLPISGPSTSPPTATGAGAARVHARLQPLVLLGVLSEFCARPDNRVTLADEKDRNGLPVARMDYSQCDNDRTNMQAARRSWTTSSRGRRGRGPHHRALRPSRRRGPDGR